MPVFHSTIKSWCNFQEIFCGGSMEQHFPGFSLQNWAYLTIGFSSTKYVVYAAVFVHKENCVGKSPILVSVYVCVCPLDIGAFQDQCTQTISFEVKFFFRKWVDHLSLVPILRPSWRRIVPLSLLKEWKGRPLHRSLARRHSTNRFLLKRKRLLA